MEENFCKKIDIDCTSNVQFQVIPPDVSDIPLPEDVSQIPLPSAEYSGEAELIHDSKDIVYNTNEQEREQQVQNPDVLKMEYEYSTPGNVIQQGTYIQEGAVILQNEQVIRYQAEAFARSAPTDMNVDDQVVKNENISSHGQMNSEGAVPEPDNNKELHISQVQIINEENVSPKVESTDDNILDKAEPHTSLLESNISNDENIISQAQEQVYHDEVTIQTATTQTETFNTPNLTSQVDTLPTETVDTISHMVTTNSEQVDYNDGLNSEIVTPDNSLKPEIFQNDSYQVTVNEENINLESDNQVNASQDNDDGSQIINDNIEIIDSSQEMNVSEENINTETNSVVETQCSENIQIITSLPETSTNLIVIQEHVDSSTSNMVDTNTINVNAQEYVMTLDKESVVEISEAVVSPKNDMQNQTSQQEFIEYVADDNISSSNSNVQDAKVKPENTSIEINQTPVEQDNQECTEEDVERLELSDDNIQYVVDQKVNPISKTNLVDYIQTHDPSIEEDETSVQYVVTNDNEQMATHIIDQNNIENALPEAVQYVVSEADSNDPNQSYVQYVVADNTVNKLPHFETVTNVTAHPEYIQYVVSEGSNQDNIVQYVVTSAGNEKNIVPQSDTDNYVSYIVSDPTEDKVVSTEESATTSEVTYEMIEETSEDVVIEEMDVSSANDQNQDIEIYVIEDGNFIEVHVEDPEAKQLKSDSAAISEDKNKVDNRKRGPIGNYIEVVDAKGDTTAKLPCHVLGRNLKNPETDVLSNGRNPPKVRPGVKIPPLCLTSCIVSSEEISEEIDKKLKAEVPVYDKPKVGDILFKHKITKRLAEKLCTIPVATPTSTNNIKVNQNQAKSSPNTRSGKKQLLTKAKPKLDNADLLAILEGDEDPDWSELKGTEKDSAPPILQAIEKSIISGHSGKSPPPVLEAQNTPRSNSTSRAFLKLDSEEKRRLAQHQLLNLPSVPNICSSRPRGRPKLTDYNPLKQTLLKNAGMAVYTTPRSKDPPKTYSNKKTNDLIKNLVSDWDEEPKEEPKATVVPDDVTPQVEPSVSTTETTKPTPTSNEKKILTKSSVATTTTTNSSTVKPVQNTVEKSTTLTVARATPTNSTKSVSVSTTKSIQSSTKSSPTLTSKSTPSTTAKPTPPSAGKRKSSPSSNTSQIGIVPNKIARVIKKKIIWDPDNPQTTSNLLSPQRTARKETSKSTESSPNVTKKTTANSASKKQSEKDSEVLTKESVNEKENTTAEESKTATNNVETRKSKIVQKVPQKHIYSNRGLIHKPATPSPNMPKKRKLTEIDKLLSDEGAVNMIYSVERRNNNAQVPEIVTKPNKRFLISLEKERRNLLSKANIIKQAVLRHSSTALPSSTTKKPLRFKKTQRGKKMVTLKKKSDQNRNASQSSTLDENPDFAFASVNESRIIRRHSSSSYSSTCTSPRRLSVDVEGKSAVNTEETVTEVTAESELSKPLKKRQKGGVPIYSRPTENDKTYKGKTKSVNTEQNTNISDGAKASSKEEEKTNVSMSTRSNKRNAHSNDIEKTKSEQEIVVGKESKEVLPEEISENISELPTVIVIDDSIAKEEAVKNAAISKKLRKSATEKKTYKEISIRRHESLVQIILTPTSTKFKNSLSVQILQELSHILKELSKDSSCHVVLVTSTGNIFCQGVDYSNLIQTETEKRQQSIQELVSAIVDLLRTLATFPKALVAGVHGAAVGFGVTILPLFDLVLASDKATFSIPATKYGYLPEGTSLMPCYRLLSQSVINEMTLACRELTASEALQYGLVTRVVWPDKFHSDLIPTIKALTTHSVKAMMITKAMLRQHLLNNLDEALDNEKKQLTEMWMSSECQESFKSAIDEGLWK